MGKLYSLRLPQTDFHDMLAAARAAGETVSEYVRKAIRMRTATLGAEKAQTSCFIADPSSWTIVAPTPVPTYNTTGCPVNVDWVRQ